MRANTIKAIVKGKKTTIDIRGCIYRIDIDTERNEITLTPVDGGREIWSILRSTDDYILGGETFKRAVDVAGELEEALARSKW